MLRYAQSAGAVGSSARPATAGAAAAADADAGGGAQPPQPPQLALSSCGDDEASVRRAFVAGFFSNAARLRPDGSYATLRDGRPVLFHPSPVPCRCPRPDPSPDPSPISTLFAG